MELPVGGKRAIFPSRLLGMVDKGTGSLKRQFRKSSHSFLSELEGRENASLNLDCNMPFLE